jgi:septum site-determining protein MinC
VVVPEEEAWSEWLAALQAKIGEQPTFFRGARVILEVGDRQLKTEDLQAAMQILNEREMTLMGLISSLPETRLLAAEEGLRVLRTRPGASAARLTDTSGRNAVSGEPAIFIERTLRSGQWVQFAGHVVVIGDVNPGAEITAGGNVVVWGKIRGVVHAGAAGDENAVVCALDLAPMQLRIGQHIARAPEDRDPAEAVPEKAFVRGERIVVEAWSLGRAGT